VHEDSITGLKPISGKRVLTASLDGYFAVFDIPSREVKLVTQVEAPIRCFEVCESRGLLLLLSAASIITTVKCLNDFSDFELGNSTRIINEPILLLRVIDDRLYFADEAKKISSLPLAMLSAVGSPHQTDPKGVLQYHHLDWVSEIYNFNESLLLTTSEDRTARLIDKKTRRLPSPSRGSRRVLRTQVRRHLRGLQR
jgi:WD40 repeat protein